MCVCTRCAHVRMRACVLRGAAIEVCFSPRVSIDYTVDLLQCNFCVHVCVFVAVYMSTDTEHTSVSLRTVTTAAAPRSVSHTSSNQQKQQQIQSFTQSPPQTEPQPYSKPHQHFTQEPPAQSQPKPQERDRSFTQPLPKTYSQLTPHTQPRPQSLSQPPPPQTAPQTLPKPTSFPQPLVKSQSLPLDYSDDITGHSVSDLLSPSETELSEMSSKQMSIKERLVCAWVSVIG